MIKKIELLDGDCFTKEIIDITRHINKTQMDILKQIKQDKKQQKTNNILLQAMINKRIYYIKSKQIFKGITTITIRQELQKIGAIYRNDLKGYFLEFSRLPNELRQFVIDEKEQKDKVISFIDSITKKEIYKDDSELDNKIENLTKLVFIKTMKNLLLDKKKITKEEQEIFNNTLKTDIQQQIIENTKKQYDILKERILQPRQTINSAIQSRVDSIKISNQDEISFVITKKTTEKQLEVCKKEYNTKKFIWLHRHPAQPQDRKKHIAWDGKEFELNKLPFNEEAGMEDYPGKLKHCHCKIRVLINY